MGAEFSHVYAAVGLSVPTSETPFASLLLCKPGPWRSPVSGPECKYLRDTLVSGIANAVEAPAHVRLNCRLLFAECDSVYGRV
jgi:hypothetical protein